MLNPKLYIEEQGISGIWNYIKYKDGTAICRCIYEWACSGWEQWGNIYTSKANGTNNYAQAPNFPFDFIEIPHISYTVVSSGSNNVIGIQTNLDGATKSKPHSIKYIRPASGGTSVNFKTSIIATGKWK